MNAHIWKRIEGLESGKIQPQELIVPGVFEILNSLNTRGVKCYLASGTDEQYVKKEAASLKLAHYFCEIFGARDDYHNFSKKIVIEIII
jgi:phosphoglycolate phosphatase